ncbi:unnamed protein product [Moneuplotes crassus]|uniref:Uncharacterized protein n=2 Tax=Euplotes crassus TaxID=5936 RepID=A0AAD1UNM9_EUPCR|nr:unnamed protein product [Moneuplotes crassus]
MSELNIEKNEWEEIEAVLTKKIRNKRKKIDKIIQTEAKVKNGEIVPTKEQQEMIQSRSKIETQMQELTEIKNGVRKEWKKVMTKHNKIIKDLSSQEELRDSTINESLGSVADALLVNLLQNEYDAKDLLAEQEKIGLEAIMVPIKSLFTPPAQTLIYNRARECFLEIFTNFVKGSPDIIPGSETTYKDLLNEIKNIPESVRTSSHRLDAQDTSDGASPEVSHEETAAVQVNNDAPIQAVPQGVDQEAAVDQIVGEGEGAVEEDKEVEDETLEETKDKTIRKQDSMKSKKYVDEDGFIYAKPLEKSKYENKALRGRGRRGGGKEKKERQRQKAKVDRGTKQYGGRGRGGRGGRQTDKFGTDEHGKKDKNAHGKHSNWHKGEVRKVE